MSLPHVIQAVTKRPGMYFSPVEFDVAAAFVQGFDLATNSGLLAGFREWLIVKLGYGNNLGWSALASRLAFPDAEPSRQRPVQSQDQQRAVDVLFSLIHEFWQDREAPNGLRRIHLAYQAWLQRQDWYGPSSPDYVAEHG